jgi:hypothetical protein
MTGTDLCVNKPHKSRSYLNHLVLQIKIHRITVYLLAVSTFYTHYHNSRKQYISQSQASLAEEERARTMNDECAFKMRGVKIRHTNAE